ncbi:hypothetical protein BJX96DRAFT_161723 [Aspergillus floccosus]
MANITIKEMWGTVKRYFGDGHVPGSAPLGLNMHICEMKGLSTCTNAACNGQNGSEYDVEISEPSMPFVSIMGDSAPPLCTCFGLTGIVKHIEDYLETAPDSEPNDFTITSWKNDADEEEVSLYAMRDALSWWTHWGGTLQPGDYWKQIYMVFATVPDDIQIPPHALVNGSYRCLGHTWADCKQGLLDEGMAPVNVEFVEMCLWREVLLQYFEKVDTSVYRLLKTKTTLMTQHRVHTANTLGAVALLLAREDKVFSEAGRDELEAAAIANCLTLDMGQEALGVLRGEKTETVAGDRAQLKRELCWIYVRCMEYLKTQPNAHILRRFGASGLHYVPMMDRYLERACGNVRFPITDAQARILEPFIDREAIFYEQNKKYKTEIGCFCDYRVLPHFPVWVR